MDETQTTAIQKNGDVEWQALNYQSMITYANGLIKSGFLPSAIKTPEQAVAIIMTGRELDIPPMQALRQINVIQGKPTVSPELMLSLARTRISGFVCNILESTNDICKIEFLRPNHKPLIQSFTIDDAKKSGLSSKDNWQKQPSVMLRWRCIAAGLRLIAPEAIMGCLTHEEMAPSSEVDYTTGEVVNLKPEAVQIEATKVIEKKTDTQRIDSGLKLLEFTDKEGETLKAVFAEPILLEHLHAISKKKLTKDELFKIADLKMEAKDGDCTTTNS